MASACNQFEDDYRSARLERLAQSGPEHLRAGAGTDAHAAHRIARRFERVGGGRCERGGVLSGFAGWLGCAAKGTEGHVPRPPYCNLAQVQGLVESNGSMTTTSFGLRWRSAVDNGADITSYHGARFADPFLAPRTTAPHPIAPHIPAVSSRQCNRCRVCAQSSARATRTSAAPMGTMPLQTRESIITRWTRCCSRTRSHPIMWWGHRRRVTRRAGRWLR